MGNHGNGHLYQKRGKGCWRVRWMVDGKLHDETTGTTDYEKARRIAAQKTACSNALGDVRALTARLEKAKDTQAAIEAKTNPSLNLFRMVEAFKTCDIIRRRKNSAATIRHWENHGNLLINEFGGKLELRQLSREMAENFMRGYERKVSPSAFNNTLQFFKRVWHILKKYDSPTELKARLPSTSPWEYIMPMRSNEVVGKRPFTPEQLVRIWRVLDERKNPDLTLLFDLARNTGARLHDLVSWRWKDIKINSGMKDGKLFREVVFEWKPIKTKNSVGKIMVIPILDQRVVDEIVVRWNKRKSDDDYILPSMLELYNHNKACMLTSLCQGVFKQAGIKTTVYVEGNSRKNCIYGMHSFRHTLVSELFQKGVDLGTIQHLYTGHGSSYITELYAHADIEKKRVDLSSLAPIDIAPKNPPKWFEDMAKEDTKLFDEVVLMDASDEVKRILLNIIRLKSKVDLGAVVGFAQRLIGNMK